MCDTFPPKLTSAAIHMADLVAFLQNRGHKLTIFTPDESLSEVFSFDTTTEVNILRSRIPGVENVSMLKRLIVELFYPYFLYKSCKVAEVSVDKFDGIVWYSPSIFFWPFYILSKV